MPKRRPPAYRRHRTKNLGYSRIDGQQVYFPGPWNSAESRTAYEARLATWRRDADPEQFPFTVADLAANYIDWADGYFTKHGEPTRHATNIRACAKLLLQQHRRTLICEFTAPDFGDWLDSLDGTPDRRCKHQNRLISRQYINKVRTAVLRMFQWGVRKGMVAPNHPEGLREIPGLAKGHTKAPEAPKVEPVETADVDAILPFLRPPVRAIVELMRLTGMRPGEAMVLRPCDVTIRADGVMVYRPHRHKLEHHDIERLIFVGPRAADVLRPFLNRDPESYCFSPRDAVADLRVQQRKNRKSKVQPSQLDRRKAAPKRTARDRYDKDSLAQAIRRACLAAGVPVWKPNQLRHAAATLLRQKFGGKEAATAVLGHSNPLTTEGYAKVDFELAARVMRQIG